MVLWTQIAAKAAGTAGGVGRRAVSSHRSHLLRWLVSLGGFGLFGVAIVDSSVIPLPLPGSTDLLLLLLTAHRGTTVPVAAWLAFCAFGGSMVGGYLTWSAGRRGGETGLGRMVPKRFVGRINGWVEKNGVWSVALAAILPPPVPLSQFLLAAGALGMARGRFLASYGAARAIRYGLLAWVGMTYGRHVVTMWQRDLDRWSAPILWAYGGVLALGLGYSLWKKRRQGRKRTADSGEAVGEVV